MNFKDSERPWLISGALGAVVVAAGAWLTVIGPEFASAAAVRSQTADAQTENVALQSKTTKLKQQSQQLPELQKELTDKLAQLPTDPEFPQLTAQINQQAAAAGVILTQVGFTTPTLVTGTGSKGSAGQTYSVGMTFAANGKLSSIQTFMRLLQQVGPRAALVSTLTFGAANGGYTLNVTMTAYTTPMTQAQANALQSELTAVAPSN